MLFGNRLPKHSHAGLADKSVPPMLSQSDLSSLTSDASPSSLPGVAQVPFTPMPFDSAAGLVDASSSPHNSQAGLYPQQMGSMDTSLPSNSSQAGFYPQQMGSMDASLPSNSSQAGFYPQQMGSMDTSLPSNSSQAGFYPQGDGVVASPAEQMQLVPMPAPVGAVAVEDPAKVQREPVYIANQKPRAPKVAPVRPRTRRRVMVHAIVTVLLILVVSGALAAVVPVGSGEAKGGNNSLLSPLISMMASNNNSASLIAAQAATATAVTQDGYDAGAATYAGVLSASSSSSSSSSSSTIISSGSTSASDSGSLNRFFYGQCTYWANMRYHELTGHWIPWLGNAYEWAYQASAYGWVTSSQPNPKGPSIIVLGPYVQNSGAYGHVAVVESAASSATNGVLTSNWNYNGDWATEDWVTFYSGSGVTFIWYPS